MIELIMNRGWRAINFSITLNSIYYQHYFFSIQTLSVTYFDFKHIFSYDKNLHYLSSKIPFTFLTLPVGKCYFIFVYHCTVAVVPSLWMTWLYPLARFLHWLHEGRAPTWHFGVQFFKEKFMIFLLNLFLYISWLTFASCSFENSYE